MAHKKQPSYPLLGSRSSDLNSKNFSTLGDSIGDGIIGADAQGEIQVINPAAEQLLGYKRAEVVGHPVHQILRVLPLGFTAEGSVPSSGAGGAISVLNRHDVVVKLHITSLSLDQARRTPLATIYVLREITDKEAVENLRAYFLASIPHEFRTPLAAICACVELLLEEQDHISKDEACALLNSILMSVSGLQALIDNLLESMNIEADQFNIRWQLTDLHQVIADATHSVKPLLNRREQELAIHFEDPIPLVEADPGRLTQAIVNLLSNATKYSPIGERIDLSIACDGERWVRVSVADRGAGIPPSEHGEIFRPFGHRRRPDEPQFGIGLGLPVVKAIIDAHDGEVGIDAGEGAGSVFWFKLPYNNQNRR